MISRSFLSSCPPINLVQISSSFPALHRLLTVHYIIDSATLKQSQSFHISTNTLQYWRVSIVLRKCNVVQNLTTSIIPIQKMLWLLIQGDHTPRTPHSVSESENFHVLKTPSPHWPNSVAVYFVLICLRYLYINRFATYPIATWFFWI